MSNDRIPAEEGYYDDELLAHLLDALDDADGIYIPFHSNPEIEHFDGDPYSADIRLTVAVHPDGLNLDNE